mmetsp:Transcript_8064/g.9149  ORF Transcript_8064/g.9149 Transcript_8064/m.9149 type:complete len:141 (+) Transcript_8064:24-446(+)
MFSKRLFARSMYLQKAYSASLSRCFAPLGARAFSANLNASSGSETVIEQQNFYTPTKAIDVEKGSFTVFDNTFHADWKFGAPYEVKETVLKNSIGIIVTLTLENGIMNMFFVPTTLFALRMFYMVAHYMSRAVNHIELLN